MSIRMLSEVLLVGIGGMVDNEATALRGILEVHHKGGSDMISLYIS
jgi:hypothetical protein